MWLINAKNKWTLNFFLPTSHLSYSLSSQLLSLTIYHYRVGLSHERRIAFSLDEERNKDQKGKNSRRTTFSLDTVLLSAPPPIHFLQASATSPNQKEKTQNLQSHNPNNHGVHFNPKPDPNTTTLHSLKLSVKYHKTHIPIHHLHQIYLSQSHPLRPQNDAVLLSHAMSRSRPKSGTSTTAPCPCRTLLTNLFVTQFWGFLVLFGFGKL